MSVRPAETASVEGEVSVVVADDQALVRAGFRAILESQPGIVVAGEAADGEEAIELVRRFDPDVVLMDIQMPGVDGLEATRRLVEPGAERPAVLMLTTFDLDAYVYDALRAGASGFLLKDTPPEDLVAAVRVVARGDALIAPGITKRLIDSSRDLLPRPCRRRLSPS
jgi:DNA-binding NarL/FixJ family response regulator